MFYVNALVREVEDEEQDGEGSAWGLAQQSELSMSEEEEEARGIKVPRPRRRVKGRRPNTGEAYWEGVRRSAWLRELLSSSTDEEVIREAKHVKPGEEDRTRFEESRRWLAEAGPTRGVETGSRASGGRRWRTKRKGGVDRGAGDGKGNQGPCPPGGEDACDGGEAGADQVQDK
jgi:hypothetical protein